MRLFIVRHGKATDAQCCGSGCGSEPAQGTDFSRELTTRGHAQARFLAGMLGKGERRVKNIIASRFPRALQTAHALQHPLACDLATDARLEVDHDVSEVLEVIHEHAEERTLMLVGHNPQLGELISVLCSGLAPQELILKTGEMVVIDIRPTQPIGSGKLVDRVRLCDSIADDTVLGTVESLGSKSR